MSRGTEFEFVSTNLEALKAEIVGNYEDITGRTLLPSDPDRIFLSVVEQILLQEKINQNYIGNQNLTSRAEGENLDALGQWIFFLPRNPAQAASATVRFYIVEAQSSAVAIPAGTRVTDVSQSMVWATAADALIPIGALYADVAVQAQTAGSAGNGYAVGQINTLIDVDNVLYFDRCENIAESYGGGEAETDDAYFERLRLSTESYTTAGSRGGYIYHAKTVSSQIADVAPVCRAFAVEKNCKLYADGESKAAFLGGETVELSSVSVDGADDGDFSVAYADGLLTITVPAESPLFAQTEIDVSFRRVAAGTVTLYALMDDGTPAGAEIKSAILNACNDEVRPMTDRVETDDPVGVSYNVDLTYYVPRDSEKSLSEIHADVTAAVNAYIAWQAGKFGRAINPSKLTSLLYDAGIRRCEVRAPVYKALASGADGEVPEYAQAGTVNVVNGGYDDE